MVGRVKAGELCGTIAGLPWHPETRGEGKKRSSGGGGGNTRALAMAGGGICGSAVEGGGGLKGRITTRGGRSSWIDTRESSVRCRTIGKCTRHHPADITATMPRCFTSQGL